MSNKKIEFYPLAFTNRIVDNNDNIISSQETGTIASNYNISYLFSKLIPLFIVNHFLYLKKNLHINYEECFTTLPFHPEIYTQKIIYRNIYTILSYNSSFKSISNFHLSEYRFSNENNIYKFIVTTHCIFTYDEINYPQNTHNELSRKIVSVNTKPVILLCLCFSRDIFDNIKKHNDHNYYIGDLNRAVLVVNNNPKYTLFQKKLNRIIKRYKEDGIENILYTEDPSKYILHENPVSDEILFPNEQKKIIKQIVEVTVNDKKEIIEQQEEGPQF